MSMNEFLDGDEYGGPWIVRPIPRNPGQWLTIADVANAVAIPGRAKPDMIALVRHWAKQGLLHPSYKETQGRGSYLYSPEQVLTAEILVAQHESGVRDTDAQRAAWQLICQWRSEDLAGRRLAPTPGAHVIMEYEAGARDWTAEIWTFRQRETGQIVFDGRLAANQRGEGTSLRDHAAGGFEPRAVFAVDLIDFLDRRHAFLFPRAVN